ncbi:MAG: hypothetical protein KAU83_07135, partial [Bacteroidales bacterium]|nr:hypothetical protein [Bacteroidales bacterium]
MKKFSHGSGFFFVDGISQKGPPRRRRGNPVFRSTKQAADRRSVLFIIIILFLYVCRWYYFWLFTFIFLLLSFY